MRSVAVITLCVVSGAIGAGIDHYSDTLGSLAAGWLPLSRSQASEPTPTSKAADEHGVEVLGDRVRCDVRYQELKIPETEYRSFFDKCMGGTAQHSD